MAHVLVDIGSSLNVFPKKALDRLDCEGLILKPSNIVVRAFDGSKRMVHGEMDIPVKVGSHTFASTIYVMDIRPSYSCLLGRPWIHKAGAVTSTLHQMLKYPVKGKIVTVQGVVPQFLPLRSLHHTILFQSQQNHIRAFGSSTYL